MQLVERSWSSILGGVVSRAETVWRAIRFGTNRPDALIPHRSVLFELSRSGAQPEISSARIISELASHFDWNMSADAVESGPLVAEMPSGSVSFPNYFDTEGETLKLLWQVTRLERPLIVVETGVANGVSTRAILSAIRSNGYGRLISFDVDPIARHAVPSHLAESAWEFALLGSKPTPRALETRVRAYAGQIGLWYHDSDHSYAWQREEFEIASRALKRPGILISDDVDGNGAFSDFVASKGLRAWYLFDGRKCSGLAVLT